MPKTLSLLLLLLSSPAFAQVPQQPPAQPPAPAAPALDLSQPNGMELLPSAPEKQPGSAPKTQPTTTTTDTPAK
jgi:hypothetical protein